MTMKRRRRRRRRRRKEEDDVDEEKKRETFTSGFYQNGSHEGEKAAETIRHDIAKMAVLTNTTYKEMFDLKATQNILTAQQCHSDFVRPFFTISF